MTEPQLAVSVQCSRSSHLPTLLSLALICVDHNTHTVVQKIEEDNVLEESNETVGIGELNQGDP